MWTHRPCAPGETHAPMNADDRYVVISADCHGGGEIHEYRDYLASQYHDEFDAWVDAYHDPLPRPARRPRQAQLGLRPAHARPRGRRHRRRGDLPEHHPALLPRRRAGHAGAAGRRARPRAAVGRAAGAQPLARRLLRAHARAAAPASRRSCCTTSTHGRGDPLGARQRADRRHPPSRRASGRRAAAAAHKHYDPIWTVCEELGMPVNHHGGSAGPPRGHGAGGHRDVPARGHVVVAQRAHQPHRRRRARASPRPAVRVHRAGHRVGARLPRPARLLLRPHAQRRRLAGARVGPAGRREDVAEAERVLGAAVPHRRELHPPVGGADPRAGRRRPDHVGERLPAQGVEPPVLEGGDPAELRRRRPGRGADDAGRATRPTLYGFDLDALRPLAAGIGPSVGEVARPLSPADFPEGSQKCPAFSDPLLAML